MSNTIRWFLPHYRLRDVKMKNFLQIYDKLFAFPIFFAIILNFSFIFLQFICIFRKFDVPLQRDLAIMHRKTTLFLFCLIQVIVGVYAHNTSDIPEEAVRTMCIELIDRYPVATLQDVYKTCYQDFFGAEHLMRDTAAARQYLHSELEQCREQDLSAMPLREPTGFRHRFVRMNLLNIINGSITEEELLQLFIDAAGKDNAVHDNWASEWRLIETIALDVHPDWRDEELQAELRTAADLQAAVRHSDVFRDTYHPHYRIIRQ